MVAMDAIENALKIFNHQPVLDIFTVVLLLSVVV